MSMIKETITYTCSRCGSPRIVRNGRNKCGSPQYHCKDCGAHRVLKPKQKHPPRTRKQVLKAYRERMSLRGVERVFEVCRQTVMKWLQDHIEALPPLLETLLSARSDDILEVDEAWSFVGNKSQKRWLWTVLCRRSGQVLAFVIGDRSEVSCRRLWQRIPPSYRSCQSFSDFWKAYARVFPQASHQSVGKGSGETAHQERWYNTLRQWVGRYTRKTLSFSKLDFYHELVTRWFIIEHNLRRLSSLTT